MFLHTESSVTLSCKLHGYIPVLKLLIYLQTTEIDDMCHWNFSWNYCYLLIASFKFILSRNTNKFRLI